MLQSMYIYCFSFSLCLFYADDYKNCSGKLSNLEKTHPVFIHSNVNFQESEDSKLYIDGHVMEIERVPHGSDLCTCIFGIRYDSDESEVLNFAVKVFLFPVSLRLLLNEI